MATRLDKPWRELCQTEIDRLGGHLGVYELADQAGNVLYVGKADARSRFGLKGELEAALSAPPEGARQFRIEVNMAYHTRHLELLQAYLHDHGRLPAENCEDPNQIGRLRPG